MPQPRWLDHAWGDFGVAEIAGSRDNTRVVRYYADVGHPSIDNDEVAWCAAFLGACLERAGLRSTRSLLARSYLGWGEPAGDQRYGAIAVLSRTSDPALGHVGFLVGETSADIILLGGNQNDSVSVQAFPRARLLGLRWPSSTPVIPDTTPVIPDGANAPIRDPATDTLFDRALTHVLEMEGGYDDDPYDPGGPTNQGITLAVYARERGVEVTADTLAQLKAELQAIPPSTVRRIYRDRYWLPASCPDLPPALAFFHFDAAVNQGVAGAARMLQQSVGAEVDAEIGPVTLAAAAARPVPLTLARYGEFRRQHYRSLGHFWRFGKGWLRRVDLTLERAVAIDRQQAPTATVAAPSLQQEKTSMATQPEPAATTEPATADTKWWGHSMTVWGVIITSLSTVLPTVGPLFGLNITADLVHQLGNQVVQVAQALGGVVGTVLTIYGRMRATTSLERRQITLNM